MVPWYHGTMIHGTMPGGGPPYSMDSQEKTNILALELCVLRFHLFGVGPKPFFQDPLKQNPPKRGFAYLKIRIWFFWEKRPCEGCWQRSPELVKTKPFPRKNKHSGPGTFDPTFSMLLVTIRTAMPLMAIIRHVPSAEFQGKSL